MSISYRIENDLIRTTLESAITPEDVRAYRSALFGDPAFRPGLNALVDCRGVTGLPSGGVVRGIAEHLTEFDADLAPARCAVLVGSAVAYGLVRMYGAFTEGSPVEVRAFRDEHEALPWLRREDEHSESP